MNVNIVWKHENVNAWSVECVVSEMSGECHVRTIDVKKVCQSGLKKTVVLKVS